MMSLSGSCVGVLSRLFSSSEHHLREPGAGVTGGAKRNPFPQDVRFGFLFEQDAGATDGVAAELVVASKFQGVGIAPGSSFLGQWQLSCSGR